MSISTIKLTKDTKSRLNKLKLHEKESYEEAIKRILEILNLCIKEPYHAKEKLEGFHKLKKKINSSKSK